MKHAVVIVGSLCLTIALTLAWCLVGVRTTGFMKRWFPNYQYLLKSHIDYLMMTGLLFIFFLLFRHFQLTPPALIVVAMSVGSVANPAAFLALSIKPDLPQWPASLFGATVTCGFVRRPSATAAQHGSSRVQPRSAPHELRFRR
jgi:O-antigen ligase